MEEMKPWGYVTAAAASSYVDTGGVCIRRSAAANPETARRRIGQESG
jgi:hypothetical protein